MYRLSNRTLLALLSILLLSSTLQAKKTEYRFLSQNFEYISDTAIEESLKSDLIEVAEATRKLLALWSMDSAKHHTIRLYKNEKKYLADSDVPGSAGMHCPQSGEVMIHLSPLSKKHLYHLDRRVLIHEVTHQMLDDLLKGAAPWLIEGLAVYVESIPFRNGRFFLDETDVRSAPILQQSSKSRIRILPMDLILRSDRSDWNAHFSKNAFGVNRQYQSAYLMTYYLLHLRAEPSSQPLPQFLEALKQTLESNTSRLSTFQTGPYQPTKQDCLNLEAAMIQAYDKIGLILEPLEGHIIMCQTKR